MVWKEDTFQHQWDDLQICAFLPFALLKQALSRVMLSHHLFMVLVAPLWPQKGMICRSSSPTGGKISWIPMLWNLLLWPHVRKFHRGLELLHLPIWKLSSDLSTRQALQRRLQRSLLQTSGNSQHVFIRISDPDSSNGLMEQRKRSRFFHWCRGRNIVPCKATVQHMAQLFLYLWKELRLTVSGIKGYKAILIVCVLGGTNVAADHHQQNVQQHGEDLSSKGDQTTRMIPVSCSKEHYSFMWTFETVLG